MNILETIGLKGGYGKTIKIIHGIDIHVKEKEIVTIIGPNGSGKSSLIKLIYGLITHHGGDAIYRQDGKEYNLTTIPSNQFPGLGIGYVPQRLNVFPNLTIDENLDMGGYTLNNERLSAGKEKVYETYPILKERRHLHARTLSGGQRQMLAMGRALITDPKLLILDEPSAALQPNLVLGVMESILHLRDELGVSVLLVEQNAKSGLAIADRGYIVAAGQKVHEDTGKKLLNETDLASYYLGYASE